MKNLVCKKCRAQDKDIQMVDINLSGVIKTSILCAQCGNLEWAYDSNPFEEVKRMETDRTLLDFKRLNLKKFTVVGFN